MAIATREITVIKNIGFVADKLVQLSTHHHLRPGNLCMQDKINYVRYYTDYIDYKNVTKYKIIKYNNENYICVVKCYVMPYHKDKDLNCLMSLKNMSNCVIQSEPHPPTSPKS